MTGLGYRTLRAVLGFALLGVLGGGVWLLGVRAVPDGPEVLAQRDAVMAVVQVLGAFITLFNARVNREHRLVRAYLALVLGSALASGVAYGVGMLGGADLGARGTLVFWPLLVSLAVFLKAFYAVWVGERTYPSEPDEPEWGAAAGADSAAGDGGERSRGQS